MTHAPGSPLDLSDLADAAREAAGDVDAALALALRVGAAAPLPGEGRTGDLWSLLATVAAADLTVARVLEPHLDALAILKQAGLPAAPDATWGVFAAEGPPPRLEARQHGDTWTVQGRKHWCSLGARLDRALVTAWVSESERGLFSVPLADVEPADGLQWAARGLSAVTSTALDFAELPAVPVGDAGWYLRRPGFAWGGIGVAAVWYGGAVGVARRLARHRDGDLDQIGLAHLGAVDAALHGARAALREAAADVDAGRADGAAGARLALRVRQVVRLTAEETLRQADHAMGPAPLALEEEHARRVDDLRLYLRQEHAARDQAALGRAVLDGLPANGWPAPGEVRL